MLGRLALLVPQLLALSALVFALLHLVPGDPVALVLGPRAAPERVAALRAALGLDDPLPEQYGRYLAGLLRGDLGTSIRGGTPVLDEILLRLGGTAALAGAGLVIAVACGISAGVLAAAAHGRAPDRSVTAAAAAVSAVPVFLLAPVLAVLLGDRSGSLLPPALCVALGPAAVLARATRAGVLDAAAHPYALLARAKGLTVRRIHWRHLLPGALVPITSLVGLIAAGLATGAVFVEVVFTRPGLGRFTVDAVLARDVPQVQGVVLLAGAAYLVVGLVVDVGARVADPRLRAG